MLDCCISVVSHVGHLCRHVQVLGRFVRLRIGFYAAILRIKLHVQLLEHQVVLRILVIDKFFEAVRDLLASCFTAQRVLSFELRVFGKHWIIEAFLVMLSISDFWSLTASILLLNEALSLAAEDAILRLACCVVVSRQATLLESLYVGSDNADIVQGLVW